MSVTLEAYVAAVRRDLDYNPGTGVFIWKPKTPDVRGWNTRYAGKEAGWEISPTRRYRSIRVAGEEHSAHRLAWLLTYGRWPEGDTDHINCDKSDNRIANLREATRSENSANRPPPAHNKSGVKGVHFERSRQKWKAFIRKDWKMINIGRYDTKAEAIAARLEAEQRIYGEFARAA